ncbi:MAG: leucyl aminopeptidase, partial [Candidatus Hydrogenedentes bacterium]|nr:leucyl aminopeptidase [Candidatus Hydrogenedentota bacterium]
YGNLVAQEDRAALQALADQGRISSKQHSIYYLPTPARPYSGVLVLGLGEKDRFGAEVLRRAAGKAAPLLTEQRVSKIVFDGSPDFPLPMEAFVEGLMLAQYSFSKYKAEPEDPPVCVEVLVISAPTGEAVAALQEGCDRTVLTCESVEWARDLCNAAPNDLTPSTLAYHAETMAEEVGCSSEVLDEDRMGDLGMEALLGVSKGGAEPAKLIVLEYVHEEADRTVALVGKGLTFDSGGISIKAAAGMHEMKYDMCGGAAVLGAMRAIALLQPKINVVCVVPSSENKTGADAQVPGDIVRAYNGKTIEVHNTDAEGRLILADALAYTVDTYKPDEMIDAATLTGAAIVGLGHYAAGVMSTDDDLMAELQLAANATGERIWPLPLWDDYAELMKGTHADLCNIGPPGEAGTVTAGCFLKEFVGDTPWAHVDIAGTAWGVKNIPYLNPDHATGYGVRLFAQWVLDEAMRGL